MTNDSDELVADTIWSSWRDLIRFGHLTMKGIVLYDVWTGWRNQIRTTKNATRRMIELWTMNDIIGYRQSAMIRSLTVGDEFMSSDLTMTYSDRDVTDDLIDGWSNH